MDKLTRALMLGEDNAVRLALLERAAARQPETLVASGEASDGATFFGEFETSGVTLAVVKANSTCLLSFCGEAVGQGSGCIVALLPIGKGKLETNSEQSGAVAVLIGNVKKMN